MPPTRDLAHNPGMMCPDRELNKWPFVLRAGTQSTEPHQPGFIMIVLKAIEATLELMRGLVKNSLEVCSSMSTKRESNNLGVGPSLGKKGNLTCPRY